MVTIGLIVPVYKNFQGLAELMASVDTTVRPIIIPNWENNLGVSAGWNEGLRRAIDGSCDLALISNDDVILNPDTIRKLGFAVRVDGYDLVSGVNTRDAPVADRFNYGESPDFSCFMVEPVGFTEKFGWFDENFTPAYFEDNDMAYRIELSGGRYANRLDAGFYHRGSVTQNWAGQQVVTGPMFESNRSYYALKWGGTPGAEIFNTPFGRADVGVDFW